MIGWTPPAESGAATRLVGVFYSQLAIGHTVDCALTVARQAVEAEGDASWFLAVLYAENANSFLLDNTKRKLGRFSPCTF